MLFRHLFNSGQPINWQWPLKVCTTNPALSKVLKEGHWTNRFCIFENDPTYQMYPGPANILLAPSAEIIKEEVLIKYSGTDLILLLAADNEHIRSPYPPTFARQADANAVFNFYTDRNIEVWFNDFIIELSHNYPVPAALEMVTSEGYLYIDQRIKQETTLSHVFETTRREYTVFPLPEELKEVEEFLGRNPQTITYEHESGDAERLCNAREKLIRYRATHVQSAPPPMQSPVGGRGSWFTDIFRKLIKRKTVIYRDGSTESSSAQGADYELETTGRGGGREAASKGPVPYRPTTAGAGGGGASGSAMPYPESSEKEMIDDGSEDAPIDLPRHLQAIIRNINEQEKWSKEYLEPYSSYTADIYIGSLREENIAAPEAIPTDIIFRESKSNEETLQIIFKTKEGIQKNDLVLPRVGDSKSVPFDIHTSGEKMYKAEIFAYHKNRLIQKLVLIASVKGSGELTVAEPIRLEVEFCIRQQLQLLEDRTPFGTSIYYENKKDHKGALVGMSADQPLDFTFNQGLENIVRDIKKYIEDAVVDIDNYPEDLMHKNNVQLLRKLAYKGNSLFVNHLKKNNTLKGPLQIITQREEYTPLEYVYTLPPPVPTAGLCDHAKQALEEGACKNCYNKTISPAPHICPFGFWSFSEVIERHHFGKPTNGNGDYTILSEPLGSRRELSILQNTIYASTSRVETEETKGLRAQVFSVVSRNCVHVYEAIDWENWSVLTAAHDPDSLILVVHTEKDRINDVDQLEIGDRQLLIQNLLDASKIRSGGSMKSPFVIVIGCETAKLGNYGFDISTQLMNEGAAIVISNFTKIRGRQAGPIVMKLVEYLKANSGTEISLGQIILKLKQYLLSRGIMVGLAIVAQGDADWKLKT